MYVVQFDDNNVFHDVVLGLCEHILRRVVYTITHHEILTHIIENLDHVVVTDNYSTSIYLSTELLTVNIYATTTIRSNKIGPLKTLRAT
jgi:hypothetical protein